MAEKQLQHTARAQEKPQTQRAVAQLRDMVIPNKLLPGSNHLEAELAEMLGISRTPEREAAIVLEGQGLVEVRPRRGVRILPIWPRDMEEIHSILTELESLAAHDVAQKGVSKAELAELCTGRYIPKPATAGQSRVRPETF